MVLNGTSWLKWMRTGGSPNRRKPRFLVGDEDIFSLANSAPVRAHLELPPWCLSDWGFFFIPPRRIVRLGVVYWDYHIIKHQTSTTIHHGLKLDTLCIWFGLRETYKQNHGFHNKIDMSPVTFGLVAESCGVCIGKGLAEFLNSNHL